jgi:hypothetical protein
VAPILPSAAVLSLRTLHCGSSLDARTVPPAAVVSKVISLSTGPGTVVPWLFTASRRPCETSCRPCAPPFVRALSAKACANQTWLSFLPLVQGNTPGESAEPRQVNFPLRSLIVKWLAVLLQPQYRRQFDCTTTSIHP